MADREMLRFVREKEYLKFYSRIWNILESPNMFFEILHNSLVLVFIYYRHKYIIP
jgi:hypothetical protein